METRISLIQTLAERLFRPGGRLSVVENPDRFLLRDDVRLALSYLGIKVHNGQSLDLRLLWEFDYHDETSLRYVFVKEGDFQVLPDIAAEAEEFSFSIQTIFRRYKWKVIRHCSLPQLEWLYNQPGRVPLDEPQTASILHEYDGTEEAIMEKIEQIEAEWHQLFAKFDFNRPRDWMPDASRLLVRALKIGQWDSMGYQVQTLNNLFQIHLQEHYAAVIGSAIPSRAPRIVTQVLPFVARQRDEKVALVVVDGMNYWQALMFCDALKSEGLPAAFHYDCIYSWLPSVTELSRQAIFRGDRPRPDYPQNPHNEERLWKAFWESKHLPDFQHHYQNCGLLELNPSHTRVAYVTQTLDEKMHASDDARYLYANTALWVKEPEMTENIAALLAEGFTIYLTTDHGNVETVPWKALRQSDKVNAQYDYRYITLAPEAHRDLFERDYGEGVLQIDADSRTYYPIDNKTFSNTRTHVTHGGTHWLEVLIPFITITKKEQA
jgi:PglZ domain.